MRVTDWIFLRCLGLIVCGGLAGCSGLRDGAARHSEEAGLVTKSEILELKSEDPAKPWDLQWALTEDDWDTANRRELFVTVHRRMNDGDGPEFTAGIYESVGARFKLLSRLVSDDGTNMVNGYFRKPDLVWGTGKGIDGQILLIRIPGEIRGTGFYKKEFVFTPTRDLRLEPVEFIPAGDSFQKFLGTNEMAKSEYNTFTDEGLRFEFYIEKQGDGNCCPTAGHVRGSYKLERKPDGGLRISMDTFKRGPSDYQQ